MKHLLSIFAITAATCGLLQAASDKPLKVFILVGQSNMEGHAAVSSFENLTLEPEVPELAGLMLDDGEPATADDVYISYLTAGKNDPIIKEGKLTADFGSQGRGPKIGPEYSFGLSMDKELDEPVLIIKAAWGGKSLHTDFRPPSAGPSPVGDEESTGHYYRLMAEHVKNVLSDPGKVHPDYDKDAGYELAGFVWFQGWNDMVARDVYPNRTKPDGYDAYGEVLAHFIRDVRKDFSAPEMPFVIGVMGIEGISTPESEAARAPRYRGITPAFRAGMAKPSTMPEFKGNVIAVETAPCWDTKLDRIMEDKKKADKPVSEEDLHYLKTGKSNQGFHYNGSPRTIGCIGKSFADALLEWHKEN
jgi:alpha-galactosidase